jgi:hypothetical protein
VIEAVSAKKSGGKKQAAVSASYYQEKWRGRRTATSGDVTLTDTDPGLSYPDTAISPARHIQKQRNSDKKSIG